MFIRTKGMPKFERFPKKASTVFAVGDLVAFDGSGAIKPAVAGDTAGFVGIIKKLVAATDSDYAANTLVEVDVNLTGDSEFEVDANGTITTAMIGLYRDIITNAGTISSSVATNTHVLVTGVGSTSTKARVRIHQQAMVA
jgi:hypothetical protein